MPDNFDANEKYIVTGSPEINLGQNVRWLEKINTTFPALQNKNYRLYFCGQLVSLIGTWLQIVAQGWLVFQITNSAIYIGLVAALSTAPTLLFTLFGGVIVDRYPKRTILLFTQASAMALAFTLGLLTMFQIIQLWQICLIAFLLGTVNALDAPARQAFVSELVPIHQLSSAIALNSGVFNAARAIGPSLAGLLIATIGTGGAFLINSLSYSAVITALLLMKIPLTEPAVKIRPLLAIKQGIQYAAKHPIIRTLLVFAGINSIFGWSYTTIMPIVAKHQFNVGAEGLGYLYAATGLGALLATVCISAFSHRISPITFILGGNALFAFNIILFSLVHNIYLAYILLFFAGFGLISCASMMNSTIQRIVQSEYRGRVMSIYILMFIGMVPIGNMQIGYLSEHLGTSHAIQIGATIVLIFGMTIFLYRNKIINSYHLYKKTML